MTAIVALNQKKIAGVRWLFRAWKSSPPFPSRLSDDYGVIARGVLICRSSHTRDSSSLWVARSHFVSSTIGPLNSASQPPSIDKGESHKGLPILAFTNELSFRKLRRVYLVVERSLDLTFDLSSIFRGASIWLGGLLFFRPSQTRCISSIKRIQLFPRRERLYLFIIIYIERYIFLSLSRTLFK